jgi:hypothetical protein
LPSLCCRLLMFMSLHQTALLFGEWGRYILFCQHKVLH